MRKTLYIISATLIGLAINVFPLFIFLFIEDTSIRISGNELISSLLFFWIISSFLYFFFLGKYFLKLFYKEILLYVPLIFLEIIQTTTYLMQFNSPIDFYTGLQVIIILATIILPFQWLAYTIATKSFSYKLVYIGIIALPILKILIFLMQVLL